jgi:hypothetical protein
MLLADTNHGVQGLQTLQIVFPQCLTFCPFHPSKYSRSGYTKVPNLVAIYMCRRTYSQCCRASYDVKLIRIQGMRNVERMMERMIFEEDKAPPSLASYDTTIVEGKQLISHLGSQRDLTLTPLIAFCLVIPTPQLIDGTYQ